MAEKEKLLKLQLLKSSTNEEFRSDRGLTGHYRRCQNIGIVKDVSISTEDWKVKAIQVSQKKRILQMLSESMFISSADIQALSDTVMLDIPADELTNSIQENPEGLGANSILGTEIILKDANKIGSADMIFFGSEDLTVACIRVKPERELVETLKLHHLQPLYLKTHDIKAAGDMIIVDITKEELTTFPGDA